MALTKRVKTWHTHFSLVAAVAPLAGRAEAAMVASRVEAETAVKPQRSRGRIRGLFRWGPGRGMAAWLR